MEEGVGDVSVSEFRLGNVRLLSEKDSKRKAVLGVRDYEWEEAGGKDSLVKKRCMEVEALLREKYGILV